MAAHIIGCGYTKPTTKSGFKVFDMIKQSVEMSFASIHDNKINLSHLDGIIAMPSLAEPKFMDAHYIATRMNLFPKGKFIAKTIDVGGASPVSGLLEAKNLITNKGFELVAVVSADAVSSMSSTAFLSRANDGFSELAIEGDCSPYIPNAYDRIAQWHIDQGYVTREQLAMVCVLMSQQSSQHPNALTKQPYSLQQVLNAPSISKVTGLLECARRADGGAAILVASSKFISDHDLDRNKAPAILGGGESSSSLYPPSHITDELFNCQAAVEQAMQESKLTNKDIQYYSLYDCFPICFVKAVEAVGLAPKHGGGKWVENIYKKRLLSSKISSSDFPINTHGGLMCFGAPWETPAMYNIIEAVAQLNGTAESRQILPHVRNALVYGNGGIFSASSIAILSNKH